MTESFDPYLEWLQIPTDERPPDHYRLLGISLFESDQRVIAEAALDVTAILRQYQLSDKADESNRLLGEVARAKACLLDPERRRSYDAEISEKTENSTTPSLSTSITQLLSKTPTSPSPSDLPFTVEQTPVSSKRRSGRRDFSAFSFSRGSSLERWCLLQLLKLRRKKIFLPEFYDASQGHSFPTVPFGVGILVGMVLTVVLLHATSAVVVTAITAIVLVSGLLWLNHKLGEHK